jgi:hypothetical protein
MAGVMTIVWPITPSPLSRVPTAGVQIMHPVSHHPQANATPSVLAITSTVEAMDTMATWR